MNNSFFEQIHESAKYLGLDLCAHEMAQLAMEQQLTDESIQAISETFAYLKQKKTESIVSTLLRLSRLPLKEPKHLKVLISDSFMGSRLTHLKTFRHCLHFMHIRTLHS